MPLRGKKPEHIEKRLKALFYGEAGAGKTTAAIQLPKPYLIDTEKGAENAQYIDLLEKQGGAIFQSSDFDEVLEEVKALLTEEHDYKTLIIDPITVLYDSLLDKAAHKVGTEFGRHYGEANKSMKHLMNLLLRLDMNVIVTAHAKNEYGKDMVLLGQTFDGYKKLSYLFDLVIEIKRQGKKRIGLIKKSRIKTLEESENFEFTYKSLAERYGEDILEKESKPQQLASKEEIEEIEKLVDLLKISNETVEKWLAKAKAASFEEMKSDDLKKCIDYLKEKINDK